MGDVGGVSLGDAIRRLLTLSSQRAFARLLAPGEIFEVASPQFGPALRNRLAVVDTGFAKVKAL